VPHYTPSPPHRGHTCCYWHLRTAGHALTPPLLYAGFYDSWFLVQTHTRAVARVATTPARYRCRSIHASSPAAFRGACCSSVHHNIVADAPSGTHCGSPYCCLPAPKSPHWFCAYRAVYSLFCRLDNTRVRLWTLYARTYLSLPVGLTRRTTYYCLDLHHGCNHLSPWTDAPLRISPHRRTQHTPAVACIPSLAMAHGVAPTTYTYLTYIASYRLPRPLPLHSLSGSRVSSLCVASPTCFALSHRLPAPPPACCSSFSRTPACTRSIMPRPARAMGCHNRYTAPLVSTYRLQHSAPLALTPHMRRTTPVPQPYQPPCRCGLPTQHTAAFLVVAWFTLHVQVTLRCVAAGQRAASGALTHAP